MREVSAVGAAAVRDRAPRPVLVLGLLLVVLLATACAPLSSRHDAGPGAATSSSPPTAVPEPVVGPTSAPIPSRYLLRPGDRGVQVRELQHRLFQLAWLPEATTGRFDATTRAAVAGFQEKRGLPATGLVDGRTWARLVRMTREPTHDQLFNIWHPGPPLLAEGDTGEQVRDLQARLVQIAWLFGDVSGTYDATTTAAVSGFQAKRVIPVTGVVDQRTWDRLTAMTRAPTYEEMHNIRPEPGALDPRCLTGSALCVDKSTNSMRWVVDGDVRATYDVRFGSEELPTREGAFQVYLKSRDHVSSLYHTSMPLALFFSGGQAVHYSPDFAAHGYSGASHGCVNVRDYDGMLWLFDQVQVGDKVIVYWS
ncbi:MAG TPA: peptidoglycan-binding protein [Nocardioides sp.]|uniref:L,D-transpeptidase family protein n=1 Tax=Nocardioides sp. TaxID=35761 RepID=UPI002BBFD147|nr:peptidoglycan-binding protein [Nocardioides sp.]HQR28424.1 peptidoglycan-binding protein [Nocardioides sp.]